MIMTAKTETQECIECGEEKDQEEFRKSAHTGSGYTSTCTECLVAKRSSGGNSRPRGYIDYDVSDTTSREERHRIAGVAPLTEEEKQAVEEATRNMLSDEPVEKWERRPEPMAPIDQLMKDGKITERRRWYLCDVALRGKEIAEGRAEEKADHGPPVRFYGIELT